MTSRPTIVGLSALLSAVILHAQPDLGGRPGVGSRFGFGAAALGSGNARASVTTGDVEPWFNPSLAPFAVEPVVHAGASSMSLDRSAYGISYVTPLPPKAGLALTVLSIGTGDIQGRDRDGLPTDVTSVREYMAGLTFGLRPSPKFSLGVSLRLWHSSLYTDVSASTVGVDLGASYLLSDDITVAAALRDLNAKYRWDTTRLYGRTGNSTIDAFPSRGILGVSWAPADLPILVSSEAERVAGGWLLRAGVQASLHQSFILRTGLDQVDPTRTLGSRWSAGLTVENVGLPWAPSFDYAFVSEPFAPSGSHHFTLRFHPRS